MYSYRLEQAIRAAAVLHKDQLRKGAMPLPYVTHLYAVAWIVADYTDSEDTVIAALLQDTLEDTSYTPDELREDFGSNVLKIVEYVTEPKVLEDKKPSWIDRKLAYVKMLKNAPEEALLIAAADKINNMRSWVEQYYDDHARFMKDFGTNLDDRIVFYQNLSNVLNSRLKNDIIAEFNHVYTEYKNFIANVKKTEGK